MGRPCSLLVSDVGLASLKAGYEKGKTHVFRERCHIVLLKSRGYTYDQLCATLNICMSAAKNWVKRYEQHGIAGLTTRPGRGPKPKLSVERDGQAILDVVKQNRQSLKAAKAAYEAEKGREIPVSDRTLRRFLKALTDGIEE